MDQCFTAPCGGARGNHIDEWHVDLANMFRHLVFYLRSWFSEKCVVFRSSLSQSGFEAVRSIRDLMAGDRIEELLVELHSNDGVSLALDGNCWLESFQSLDRAFEADRSRITTVFGCRLRDNRTNEIVGQDVRPHFLSDELRRFTSQDLHLHRRLDRSQIELIVPTRTIQEC